MSGVPSSMQALALAIAQSVLITVFVSVKVKIFFSQSLCPGILQKLYAMLSMEAKARCKAEVCCLKFAMSSWASTFAPPIDGVAKQCSQLAKY